MRLVDGYQIKLLDLLNTDTLEDHAGLSIKIDDIDSPVKCCCGCRQYAVDLSNTYVTIREIPPVADNVVTTTAPEKEKEVTKKQEEKPSEEKEEMIFSPTIGEETPRIISANNKSQNNKKKQNK